MESVCQGHSCHLGQDSRAPSILQSRDFSTNDQAPGSNSGALLGDGQSHDHTHSQYAFVTAHIHVSLYRERRVCHVRQKGLKKQRSNSGPTRGYMTSKRDSHCHCSWHQQGGSSEAQRNRTVDLATWKADPAPVGPLQILVTLPEPEMLQHPSYTWEETKWAKEKREEARG